MLMELPLQRLMLWRNDVEEIEQGGKSWIDEVSTTSGRLHCSDPKKLARVDLVQIPFAFIHNITFNQKFQQSDWLLRTIGVNIWHGQIVDEYD